MKVFQDFNRVQHDTQIISAYLLIQSVITLIDNYTMRSKKSHTHNVMQ